MILAYHVVAGATTRWRCSRPMRKKEVCGQGDADHRAGRQADRHLSGRGTAPGGCDDAKGGKAKITIATSTSRTA